MDLPRPAGQKRDGEAPPRMATGHVTPTTRLVAVTVTLGALRLFARRCFCDSSCATRWRRKLA
jgi:hypothetical protein